MKVRNNVTSHDLSEWSRLAQAAYKAGRNDVGHRFSVAAALGLELAATLPVATFDRLTSEYRAWLAFGELPRPSE